MASHLVLGIKRMDFEDSNRNRVQLCKITYIDKPEDDRDAVGYFPLTVTAGYDFFKKFKEVPAYYELEFKQKPDSKGKPQLVLDEVTYLQESPIK